MYSSGRIGRIPALMTMLVVILSFLAPIEALATSDSSSRANISTTQEKPILLACATCGCSEVCPLALVDPSKSDSSVLTESIWGNIILKMAYQRDPQLQKLSSHYGIASATSVDALTCVAVGTLGQNVSSLAALNPPTGIEDSYGPGTVGLSLDVVTNVVFGARAAASYHYHKKIKQRQLVVRQHVEQILQHLEYSKTDCSEAQADLAALIGERASKECLQLWQSSHLATVPEQTPLTDASKSSIGGDISSAL